MRALFVIFAAIAAFLISVILFGISALGAVVLGLSVLYLVSGIITVVAMLHSWVEPKRMYGIRPPKEPRGGKRATFSLIIPCRHEEAVIGDTLAAMSRIDYPRDLYEVLVSVRDDDYETASAAQTAIDHLVKQANYAGLPPPQMRVVTFSGGSFRKARNLNAALAEVQYGFVGVFDAEDEPHPSILRKVEAVIQRKEVDAVQAGVQLINVSSRWFTIINCLEYYFWFKSVLPFLAKLGATPVGGNTIFFRSKLLHRLGGWDEECLTEDADIGIRISAEGHRIAMIYDETLSTLEEAPVTLAGFLRQRSRWDQGYFQVLAKGNWARLGGTRQQLLTLYLLVFPLAQLIFAIGAALMPFFAALVQVELPIAVFSFLPLYFLFLQLGIFTVGLGMLKRQYHLRFSPLLYPAVWVTYFPYQLLLGLATFRALWRSLANVTVWDKTTHTNAHRAQLGLVMPQTSVVPPAVTR